MRPIKPHRSNPFKLGSDYSADESFRSLLNSLNANQRKEALSYHRDSIRLANRMPVISDYEGNAPILKRGELRLLTTEEWLKRIN